MSIHNLEDFDNLPSATLDFVLRTEPEEDFDVPVGEEIGDSLSGKDLESIVDEDLKNFAQFYIKTLGNSKLSDYEKAVIKTFIWWKTHTV
jgi:hypothetical protein